MSEIGDAVALEAEGWVGTPFLWGQSTKGVGADCKGLIAGVARELGRPEADSVEALACDYDLVDPIRLEQGLANLFDPVLRSFERGDIILMIIGGKAQHMAIVTEVTTVKPEHEGIIPHEPTRIVHCYSAPPSQVIAATVGTYHKSRIKNAWRWRVIDGG
jgi:hypothetical protein